MRSACRRPPPPGRRASLSRAVTPDGTVLAEWTIAVRRRDTDAEVSWHGDDHLRPAGRPDRVVAGALEPRPAASTSATATRPTRRGRIRGTLGGHGRRDRPRRGARRALRHAPRGLHHGPQRAGQGAEGRPAQGGGRRGHRPAQAGPSGLGPEPAGPAGGRRPRAAAGGRRGRARRRRCRLPGGGRRSAGCRVRGGVGGGQAPRPAPHDRPGRPGPGAAGDRGRRGRHH